MEIMLSHLGVGMTYDALDGLNVHAQRLHVPLSGIFIVNSVMPFPLP